MGRPTKLTPAAQAIIEKAVGLGATFEASANAAGVHYDTFNRWMHKGEAAKSGQYRLFYEAVKKAIGDRQARWLSQIEQAAQNGTWQAAAWKLERTDPDNFGRQRLDVQHTGKDGGDIVLKVYGNDSAKDV